jgi:hypothetical protein
MTKQDLVRFLFLSSMTNLSLVISSIYKQPFALGIGLTKIDKVTSTGLTHPKPRVNHLT